MSHHTGGCRCGAIRFEAAGEPVHISYCHCGDCRRASGAPLTAFIGFGAADVTFHGEEGAAYLHIDDGLPRRETTTVPRPEGENR